LPISGRRKSVCIALLVALGVTMAACQGIESQVTRPRVETTVSADRDPSAEVMAAALMQLVTKDHTFGQGKHRFAEYLIQRRINSLAGGPLGAPAKTPRDLTDAERVAITAVIAPLGPVRFVEDPADWRTKDLQPTVDGSVILGVGTPTIGDGTALVPVSLWCGGLCGTWLTYRLTLANDVWRVTGTKGPIAVS
jgi:hypothetical protein